MGEDEQVAEPKVLRRWGGRVVGLLVTAAGLYVVAPSLLSLFDAWPSLGDVRQNPPMSRPVQSVNTFMTGFREVSRPSSRRADIART